MKTFVGILLFAQIACGVPTPARVARGSEINTCILCHGMRGMWKGDKIRRYIAEDKLAEDLHFQAGLQCYDCHGGNPQSLDFPIVHAKVANDSRPWIKDFKATFEEIQESCKHCHEKQASSLAASVHSPERVLEAGGSITAPTCQSCHGEVKHGLRRHDDPGSSLFVHNQADTCGNCHTQGRADYLESIHGHGLVQAGLTVTAVCADCHGAHDVLPADQPGSRLHAENVSATCAKCHRYIADRVQASVHSRQTSGEPSDDPAARMPTCIDCHQRHEGIRRHNKAHLVSADGKLQHSGQCGDCHADASRHFDEPTIHAVIRPGKGLRADCSDCHGAHEIRPLEDADSMLSETHRVATCSKCHERLDPVVISRDVHATHAQWGEAGLFRWDYLTLITLLGGTVGAWCFRRNRDPDGCGKLD